MEDVQAGYGPALPWSAKEVRDLLRSTGGKRKIGRRGIEFEALYYHSPELEALRSAMEKRASQRAITTGTNEAEEGKLFDEDFVAVTYDPGDLSAIYVQNPLHDEEIWLRVPAVDQETRGLTFWQHRVIRKHLAQKQRVIDSASLRNAKEAIQMVVEQQFQLMNRSIRERGEKAIDGVSLQTTKGAIQMVVDQEFQRASQSTRARKKVVRYNGTGARPTSFVDMTDSVADSALASPLHTTPSASVVSAEPPVEVIENPSPDPSLSVDSTHDRDIQQPVAAAHTPRKIAQKKLSTPVSLSSPGAQEERT